MYFLCECLRVPKKAKCVSSRLTRQSELWQFWKKTNCKASERIHDLSSLSDSIYPGKISGPSPARSAQHTEKYLRNTWSTSTDDIHTSHLTTVDKQNWLTFSYTRGPTTVESVKARNGSWRLARTRGVGLFRLLSAPIYMSCWCMLVRVWTRHD